MVFERFSVEARKAMSRARQEAQRLGGEYIDTEHILLGIIHEGEGCAARILKNLNVDLKRIRAEIEKRTAPSSSPTVMLYSPPFSHHAKQAIERADEAAGTFGHDVIGTEHLLLGLLEEKEGIAAQVLACLGLNPDGMRNMVLRVHEHGIMPLLAEFHESEFIGLLEHMGMVTDPQLQEAAKRSQETGTSIPDILMELGYVPREEMLKAIGAFQEMKGPDAISIPLSDTHVIPPPLAWAYHVVPIKHLGDITTMALATSQDVAMRILDDLRQILGRQVAGTLAPRDSVMMALKRRYPIDVALDRPPVKRGIRLEVVPGLAVPAGADLLLFVGLKESFRVWCRVDGAFYEAESPPLDLGMKIMEDLKSRVNLGDPGLHRLKLHISIIPTPSGESAILRLGADPAKPEH